jgi:hypothetical protein
LVRQGDIHHQVRLVGADQGDDFVHMIRIHLGGGDIGFGDGSQLGSQVVTLGFGTAGDTDVGEHLADLAAFLDGNRGDTAAADDQNSTHILSTPFRFFVKKLGKKLSAFL